MCKQHETFLLAWMFSPSRVTFVSLFPLPLSLSLFLSITLLVMLATCTRCDDGWEDCRLSSGVGCFVVRYWDVGIGMISMPSPVVSYSTLYTRLSPADGATIIIYFEARGSFARVLLLFRKTNPKKKIFDRISNGKSVCFILFSTN